jgi:hypothetical protein
MTCGATFPSFVAGDTVQRWFVSPTSRIANLLPLPNPAAAPTPLPITVLVDTYAGSLLYGVTPVADPGPPSTGWTGYLNLTESTGETIVFGAGGARTIRINGLHIAAEISGYVVWDVTVSTVNPVTLAAGTLSVDGANNVSAGGTIYIQNNRSLYTVASQVTTSLGYTTGCGVPTSGAMSTSSISGAFSAETMSFTATCGNATYNGATAVTLMQSY